MKTSVLSLALLASISQSFAGSLDLTPSGVLIEGASIAKSGNATVAEGSFSLLPTGAGVRIKTVLIVPVKIYVAQMLVDQKDKFSRTPVGADMSKDMSALGSLSAMNAVALKLDMLRDLDAATLVDSFANALKANGLAAETDEGLAKVLSAIEKGGDLIKKDSITIVGVNGATTDKLYIENSNGVTDVVEGDNKLVEKMFSIWLGVPADNGLANLKAALTK